MVSNHHKAHLYAARSIREPAVCVGGAYRAFVPLHKGRSGNEDLFVPGFRTTIPDDHITRFCWRALRLLAFSLYHRDDDFSGLCGSHVDRFRLARKPGSSRVVCSDKIFNDIHGFLSVRRVLAKDSDAQIEPFREPTKGKAQVTGQCARLRLLTHFTLESRHRSPRSRCPLWAISWLMRPAKSRHSITSSAIASSVGGMVRPSALAVVRLMTRSNLVGCSTGRSPGLAPRKILSTYSAARNRAVFWIRSHPDHGRD
jgi:hypothetical protein